MEEIPVARLRERRECGAKSRGILVLSLAAAGYRRQSARKRIACTDDMAAAGDERWEVRGKKHAARRGGTLTGRLLLLLGACCSGCLDWDSAQRAFCVNNPRCPENGGVVWAQAMGLGSQESALGVETLPDGAVAVVGVHSEGLTVGPENLPGLGKLDGFLAVFGRDGSPRWARNIGDAGEEGISGVVTDETGNIVVVGFTSSASINWSEGASTLQRGPVASFWAKYSPGGDLIWARSISSEGAQVSVSGAAYAADAQRLVVAGSFLGSVRLGQETLNSTASGMFVAAVHPENGELERLVAKGSCSPGGIRGQKVATFGQSAFVVAQYEGSCLLGNTALASTVLGSPGLAIAKFSLSGEQQWVSSFPEAAPDSNVTASVAVNAAGDPVVSGAFRGIIRTGLGGNVASQTRSASDVLLLAMDGMSGALRWAARAGGDFDDKAMDVSVDSSGHVWVVGSFQAPATFGPLNLTNPHQVDAFFAEYTAAGEPIRALPYYGSSSDTLNEVTSHPDGWALVGQIDGPMTIGNHEVKANAVDAFVGIIAFPQ